MSDTQELELWEVKLSGPCSIENRSWWSMLSPWGQPKWREVTIHMHVGSDDCPDWNQVNLRMTAIQELIAMANGAISDDVLTALQTHTDVVSIQTYRSHRRP